MNLDITFILDCRWLKARPLFLYYLKKCLAIHTSPFFRLLVNVFSVTGFLTFFDDPLPSLYWWAVSVGGKKFIFDCRYRVVEGSTLVSIHFTEAFSHPNISFYLVSVLFDGPILFDDPLLSLYWWAVSVGISDVAFASVHYDKPV